MVDRRLFYSDRTMSLENNNQEKDNNQDFINEDYLNNNQDRFSQDFNHRVPKNDKVILCYDRDTFEKVYMYNEDRYLHTQIIGPTGTGKTSQILIPLMFQDIVNNNAGLVLVDPKGDLAEDFYKLIKQYFPDRNIIYVDPLSTNSPKYNPLKGDLMTITKNMVQIFQPPFKVSTIQEKHNVDSIRTFIVKSLKLINLCPELIDGELNLESYYTFISNKYNEPRSRSSKLLTNLQAKGVNRLIEADIEKKNLLEWITDEYFDNKYGLQEKVSYLVSQIQDIISNPYLLNILTPSNNDTKVLDIPKGLSEGDIIIINSRNTALGELSKIFGEFLLLEYKNAVFDRVNYERRNDPNFSIEWLRPNFLFIDEFPTFSPVITEIFTQGRSFKVGVHIVYQNRSLLEICGNVDTSEEAKIIEANTRNIILFPGLNGDDGEFFSHNFTNFTKNEIIYRPFGQITYRIIQDKSITIPKIGLVFFLNEEPHKDSIDKEFIME